MIDDNDANEIVRARLKVLDKHFASCAKRRILRRCRKLELRQKALNMKMSDETFCKVFEELKQGLMGISTKHSVPLGMVKKDVDIEFEAWLATSDDDPMDYVLNEMLELFQ